MSLSARCVRHCRAWTIVAVLCAGAALPAVVWAKPTHSGASQNDAWQTITVHDGDSLSGLLAKHGVRRDAWKKVLALGGHTDALTRLEPGDVIALRRRAPGELIGLRYRLDALRTLVIGRRQGRLQARVQQRRTRAKRLVAVGKVRRSLPRSLAAAGVPPKIANQLARIYRPRLDLDQTIEPGDRFCVIYKALYHDQRRIVTGPVIAARITTDERTLSAFRAIGPGGRVAYYDAAGAAIEPGISRHPVDYTRISSPFSLHRMDPAVHFVHPHYGVDMAAPTGTPIHAAAGGTVKFVGRARGYGKLVELRHFKGYSTRYAHLHRFAHGLHDGEHVKRGQTIGTVGSTGWSTGPHLLFEIRLNGTPHNPMTMPLPSGRPLTQKRLARFQRRIRPLIAKLDDARATSPTLASAVSSPDCRQFARRNARLALGRRPERSSQQRLLCVVHGPPRRSLPRLTANPRGGLAPVE